MRGDQLARQRRVIGAIEASLNGFTGAEIAQRRSIGFRTTYRDLEALQARKFSLHTTPPSPRKSLFTLNPLGFNFMSILHGKRIFASFVDWCEGFRDRMNSGEEIIWDQLRNEKGCMDEVRFKDKDLTPN